MRTMFGLIAILAATPVVADVKGPGGRTIDCFCTDTSGSRIELGETICLFVDGRAFTAQCQMSLNLPMWREVSEGCLSSSLSLPQSKPHVLEPAVETGPVDPQV